MASRRSLRGTKAKKIRNALMAKQGCRCCYCGDELKEESVANRLSARYPTVEHIEDRARGGCNKQFNLAVACFACNQRAGLERWSPEFKRHKIEVANIIALADLVVEHMEVPPLYLQQVGRAA
jgi:5-methylcytosine-specific restriction endonuclease McrA